MNIHKYAQAEHLDPRLLPTKSNWSEEVLSAPLLHVDGHIEPLPSTEPNQGNQQISETTLNFTRRKSAVFTTMNVQMPDHFPIGANLGPTSTTRLITFIVSLP